jgi:hypothetical protein
MNDETYEDDVVDDDDNNNNNNNNALQFYHTMIWSILVDYIVDSYILCLFSSSSFLSFDILYDIDPVTDNNNNKQYY